MKYLPLIILIATLISCKPSPAKQDDGKKYFEGFVEFTIKYTGNNAVLINRLNSVFGTRVITYVGQNGFYAREYIDSTGIILSREIYRPDSLKDYLKIGSSDTIITSNVTVDNNSVFVSCKKDSALKILGHNVDVVVIKTLVPNNQYQYSTYYNDVNYLLHPSIYKGYIRGGIQEIFSRSPHVTTGFVVKLNDQITMTAIAIRIQPSLVDNLHFEIPKNKVIVEQ